jgi:hypothetical protein
MQIGSDAAAEVLLLFTASVVFNHNGEPALSAISHSHVEQQQRVGYEVIPSSLPLRPIWCAFQFALMPEAFQPDVFVRAFKECCRDDNVV